MTVTTMTVIMVMMLLVMVMMTVMMVVAIMQERIGTRQESLFMATLLHSGKFESLCSWKKNEVPFHGLGQIYARRVAYDICLLQCQLKAAPSGNNYL